MVIKSIAIELVRGKYNYWRLNGLTPRWNSKNIAGVDGLEKAFDHLMDISNHNTKATYLVGGDFNAGDIDWDSLAVKPSSDQ